MKKILFIFIELLLTSFIFGAKFNFTDDYGRNISINKPKKVAVLHGSLASLWLISGGRIEAATADCFSGPPEMSEEKATLENEKWNTDGFKAHKAGFFEYLEVDSKGVKNVGTLFNPNTELLIAYGIDFVILSKAIVQHKKIEPILTKAGIKCAFFEYEDFDSYLRLLELFCKINGKEENFQRFGKSQENEIKMIEEKASQRKSKPRILLLRASPASIHAKTSETLSIGKLLKALGTENIADSDKVFTEHLSMEKIISEDPDFIFIDTMGANDEKSLEMIRETLESNPVWKNLSAVKNGRYFILPKELFHFKPGKRWSESYKVLYTIIGE